MASDEWIESGMAYLAAAEIVKVRKPIKLRGSGSQPFKEVMNKAKSVKVHAVSEASEIEKLTTVIDEGIQFINNDLKLLHQDCHSGDELECVECAKFLASFGISENLVKAYDQLGKLSAAAYGRLS